MSALRDELQAGPTDRFGCLVEQIEAVLSDVGDLEQFARVCTWQSCSIARALYAIDCHVVRTGVRGWEVRFNER